MKSRRPVARHYFFLFVLVQIIFSASCGSAAVEKKEKEILPNIVIIMADDMGWNDVGYHNIQISTPNIDKLVRESLELDRFYTYFNCTPTRAGLLTGLYPGRLGLSGKVISPKMIGGLRPDFENLAKSLRSAGYKHRACIGKWHLGHSNKKYHPLNQGFSYFYGNYSGQIDYFKHIRSGKLDWHRGFAPNLQEGYATNLISNEATKFINESKTGSPFFLYVPFTAPHTPLQAPKEELAKTDFEFKGDYDSQDYSILSTKNKRELFKAMLSSLDQGVGDILKAIKAKGIEEETMVIFLSDNGGYLEAGASNKPFRGQKGEFYEGGVRVPACIRYPKEIKQASVSTQITSFIDLYPTILDVVGQKNTDLDGISLRPLFSDANAKLDREYYYVGRGAIVRDQWKLINRQLYNLGRDKSEKKDLAKQFPKIHAELSDKLQEFSREIEKPSILTKGYKVRKNWKMP